MSRILLIEDDLQMQELISEYLKNYEFDVKAFSDPLKALESLKKDEFDLVILDLMLPKIDGFEMCKKIKEIKDIPIIISSARGDITDKILGYEKGADDYLAKPYEPRELVLRIEALLKRAKKDEPLKIGEFLIDEKGRTLKVDDFEVDLTKIEFEIFLYLIKNKGRVLSREQILHSTSLDGDTKNRTIDMHISNIRYKIGDDPKNPKYIKSVWGIGYKFL